MTWRSLGDSNPCFRRERVNTRTPMDFGGPPQTPIFSGYCALSSTVIRFSSPPDVRQKLGMAYEVHRDGPPRS